VTQCNWGRVKSSALGQNYFSNQNWSH